MPQLYSQIDELKREAQQKGAEAVATRQELQNELTLKVYYPHLQSRCVTGACCLRLLELNSNDALSLHTLFYFVESIGGSCRGTPCILGQVEEVPRGRTRHSYQH
jgi:hypothetical protein